MSPQIDLSSIKEGLEAGKSCLVVFGQNITVDHVASALSLYLALKESGRDVYIASPAELRAEFSRLVGLDKISSTLGNKNLVIGFQNYGLDSIEKISHNDGSGSRFELIIQPKSGNKAPDPSTVEFSYRGLDAQIIFLIGVNRLEDLGEFYEVERNAFNQAMSIVISRRQTASFASVSVVDESASSYSEIILELLHQLGLKVQEDIATNLIAGLDFATNRFQNPVIAPSAFVAMGKLMEFGGKRQTPIISSAAQVNPMATNRSFTPFAPVSAANQPFAQPSQTATDQPPQDWLQPKIFKGTSAS